MNKISQCIFKPRSKLLAMVTIPNLYPNNWIFFENNRDF